ncbi:hypothetical protein [Aureibacter tunicatorum]|uniref:Uncharacterized protein n=1 Tax=Aureibacter tunicatorum TaxID=866807 RepID=A0AAE3XSW3_9BACT|nr:hypothetical protein [Aureibacter tunicatorum]MDR6241276.1 hypothetical protein [Aureibacter tunicatorum]BDD03536.1 hypothetical protein AUTU_10190 [Aureibacter tunicatorum]
MDKVVSPLRAVTLIVFVGVLLYIYSGLPNSVLVGSADVSQLDDMVSRNEFFYGTVVFVLIANLAFLVLGNLMKQNISSSARPALIKGVVEWLAGFNAILNLIFTLSVVFIGMLNNNDIKDLSIASPLIYAMSGLFLIGLAWLVKVLLMSKSK